MITVYVIINIAWLLIWHHFVQKEINYSLFDFVKDLFPYLFIAVGSMAIAYICTSHCTDIFLRFASKFGIAASLYIFIMWLSGSTTFKESVNYIFKRTKSV